MREGKILNPEKLFFDEKGSADVQLDCKGSIIAPGFIDVQINGKAKGRRAPGCSAPALQTLLPTTQRVPAGHQLLEGAGSH